MLALEELRLARLHHADLLEHLSDNDADVLVVDLHTLEAIDLLHLVQQVFLHRARTLDAKDIVRVDRTFRETISGAHTITFVHTQVLAGRDFIQLRLGLIVDCKLIGASATTNRLDEDLTLTALDVAKTNDTVDLGNRGRILRLAGLEQLGNTRQTARDVAGLVRFSSQLRHTFAREDLVSVLDGELCANRDDEVADLLFLSALRLPDLDVWMQLLFAVLDHDALAQAGELIELLGHRLIFDEIHEPDFTLD